MSLIAFSLLIQVSVSCYLMFNLDISLSFAAIIVTVGYVMLVY